MSRESSKPATLQELNEYIDVATVYNDSEEKWFKAQRRKRGILEKVIAGIPAFMLIAFISWYLSGAPHTVAVIALITTPTYIDFLNLTINWSIVAPVGLELGIVLIAIMRAAGWDGKTNIIIEGFLILMLIVINLLGSLIAVQDKTIETSTLESNAGLIVSFMMGFGIPIMTAWLGSAFVKLATGKVSFEIVDLTSKWLVEGRDFFRRELYRVALNKGAGTSTATKFSDRLSSQYFENTDNWDNDRTVQNVPLVQQKQAYGASMGFGAMAESRMNPTVQQFTDSQDLPPVQTVPMRMTKEIVQKWVDANPDKLQVLLNDNMRVGKRTTAQRIAVEMGYTAGHYKTVERVLGDKLK